MTNPKRKPSPARQRTRSHGGAKNASPKIPRVRGKKKTPSEKTRTALEQQIQERPADLRLAIEKLHQEIAERKRAQAALHTLNSRLDFLLSASPGTIYTCELTPPYAATFVSVTLTKALGYTVEEFLSTPGFWADHLHPEDRDRVFAGLPHLFIRGSHLLEYRFQHKDGGWRWMKDALRVVPGPDGKAVELIGYFIDITERKAAEEEIRALNENLERLVTERTSSLRKSEERYRYWMSTMPGAVYEFCIDAAGHRSMPFISKGIADLTGLSPAEAMTDVEVLFQRIHPDAMPAMEQSIRTSLESLAPWLHEFPIRTTTGEAKWLRGHSVPIRKKDGATCWTGVLVDVTERKRAEAALQAAQEQVRQMQKMEALSRLAGGIAHDFNNLLTAILSQSELILMALADRDPALRNDVEAITQAVRRGAALTRQLLTLSRRQPLQPQVLDLARLVADLAPMLQRMLGEQVALEVRPDSTVRPITADPDQMEQVLLNLAINARDAMPQGGRLTLAVTDVALNEAAVQSHPGLSPSRYARLTVSDTGSGMDEETQRHLFEPFFTTKEKGKGTGLGLATVFGIVTQSGGHIACSSAPGHGTTFELYFPSTGERAIAPPAPTTAPVALTTGTETILLVEDDDAVRLSTLKLLCRIGYTVLDAASPLEALRLVEHYPTIPLLLTDVVMPQMHGDELARRVKALHPAIKVIHMSGYTDDALLRDGRLPHGDAFLAKPFTPDALMRTIRAVLDGPPSPNPPAHPT